MALVVVGCRIHVCSRCCAKAVLSPRYMIAVDNFSILHCCCGPVVPGGLFRSSTYHGQSGTRRVVRGER